MNSYLGSIIRFNIDSKTITRQNIRIEIVFMAIRFILFFLTKNTNRVEKLVKLKTFLLK